MLTRRTLLAGALGAGALVATHELTAGAAGSVRVGAEVVNHRNGATVPWAEFTADVDRLLALGCNAIRMSCPLYVAGDVYQGRWFPTAWRIDQVRQQVAYAKSKGLFVSVTIAAPAIDPHNTSFDQLLWVNKQALTDIAASFGSQVDMWQLFNEWNMFHWVTHQPMPQPLTDRYHSDIRTLFIHFAPILHQANPKTLVTSAIGGYPSVQTMWSTWEELYRSVGGALDVWGVIAYPDPSVPSQWPAQAASIQHMRSVSGKPVAIMETGMCTPTGYMANQAVSAVPGMLRGMANGAPVAQFLYQLRDAQTGSSDKEMNFGAYTTDGSRKSHWQPTHDTIVAIVNGY